MDAVNNLLSRRLIVLTVEVTFHLLTFEQCLNCFEPSHYFSSELFVIFLMVILVEVAASVLAL